MNGIHAAVFTVLVSLGVFILVQYAGAAYSQPSLASSTPEATAATPQAIRGYHGMCLGTSCIKVDGFFGNECDADNPASGDCGKNFKHMGCVFDPAAKMKLCMQVDGKAPDECSDHVSGLEDCNLPVYSHYTCVGNRCVAMQGYGESTCYSQEDCRHTFNQCQGSAGNYMGCPEQNGRGRSQCYNPKDCASKTHEICSNYQCKEVPGTGDDLCSKDDDCDANAQGN